MHDGGRGAHLCVQVLPPLHRCAVGGLPCAQRHSGTSRPGTQHVSDEGLGCPARGQGREALQSCMRLPAPARTTSRQERPSCSTPRTTAARSAQRAWERGRAPHLPPPGTRRAGARTACCTAGACPRAPSAWPQGRSPAGQGQRWAAWDPAPCATGPLQAPAGSAPENGLGQQWAPAACAAHFEDVPLHLAVPWTAGGAGAVEELMPSRSVHTPLLTAAD